METIYNACAAVAGISASAIWAIPKVFTNGNEIHKENIVIKESLPISGYVRLAGLSGCLAIGLGAYGAHALKDDDIDPERKHVFDTAYRMHLIHSVALTTTTFAKHPFLTGTLMSIGMAMFCGPCYLHAFTGKKDLPVRYLVPAGGTILMLSWLTYAL